MLKDFSIIPTFLSTTKVESIFEYLLKSKVKVDKNMLQFGLSYDEFLHALMRITIKCSKNLKMFHSKYQRWEAGEEDEDLKKLDKKEKKKEEGEEKGDPQEKADKKWLEDMKKEWRIEEEVSVTLEQDSVVKGFEGLMVHLSIPKHHLHNVNKYRDIIAARKHSLANHKLLKSKFVV